MPDQFLQDLSWCIKDLGFFDIQLIGRFLSLDFHNTTLTFCFPQHFKMFLFPPPQFLLKTWIAFETKERTNEIFTYSKVNLFLLSVMLIPRQVRNRLLLDDIWFLNQDSEPFQQKSPFRRHSVAIPTFYY